MDFIVSQTFNALSYGALLFLIAAGFTLILGIMTIVNISHGSFYILGGYFFYSLMVSRQLNYLQAILGASIGVSILGVIIERVFLRRMEGSWTEGNDLRQMIVTMGVALVIQDACIVIWGGYPLAIELPATLGRSVMLWKYQFPTNRITMIFAALVVFAASHVLLNRTILGAKIRASVDNANMASGVGINVSVIKIGIFALGAFLAAIGGIIGGTFMAIYPGLDFEILPYAFVVVVLGGMGSLTGAFIGSFVVGVIDNFGKALIPEFAYFTLFAVLALVLAFKPTGILGKE
jgi:branched-chain amino acid transport system permease protein